MLKHGHQLVVVMNVNLRRCGLSAYIGHYELHLKQQTRVVFDSFISLRVASYHEVQRLLSHDVFSLSSKVVCQVTDGLEALKPGAQKCLYLTQFCGYFYKVTET